MTDDTRWAESMPEVYDRCLGPAVFAPYGAHLAALARGPRVLELAAGSGVVTRELVARGLAVTATDLNQAMVDHGRLRVPEAAWETADALALPFADASFDEVVVSFGVMFLPDKAAAFAEMRRVLVPGGRVLVSVWHTLETSFFEHELMAELLPLEPGADFLRRTPHGYADPDRIRADAVAGGLEVTALDQVVLAGTSTAGEIAEGYCLGTPVRFELSDPASMAVLLAEKLTARWGSGPVTGDLTAWVLQARRP